MVSVNRVGGERPTQTNSLRYPYRTMLHIPILRHGREYKSLDVVQVQHHRTREPFVEISQANPGLIRRDLLNQQAARRTLAEIGSAELLRICGRAAKYFLNESLSIG